MTLRTANSGEQAVSNMVLNSSEPDDSPGGLLAQKSSSRSEIKPLTTLRFFAAFAVVINHASDSFSCWHGLSSCFIVGQAVTFFFVLSGFILTYNYFNLNGMKAALRFYVARIARIWPAHLCTLLLLLLLIPEVFKLKSADLPLFFCNLFLLQSWIPSWHVFFSYNASAWSISTEMFFYLCFPLLLWCLNKKWYLPLVISSTVLVGLICGASAAHLPEYDPVSLSNQGLLYINPLSSIFNFCIGMTAAVLWRDHLQKVNLNIALATALEIALLISVCVINVSSSSMRYWLSPWVGDACAYWAQNSGPSVLGFALLISIFAMNQGWISRLFSNSMLVLLGELSFGIYMLHGVLITFIGINFPQEQSVQACLGFLTVLFVSAHLMFEIVEKPMRSFLIKGGNSLVSFSTGRGQGKVAVEAASNAAVGAAGYAADEVAASSASTGSNQGSNDYKFKIAPWASFDVRVNLKKRTFLAIEALVFLAFIYFSVPTIHQLSDSEARAISARASVTNVQLPPFLVCKSASSRQTANRIESEFVWESTRAQNVNYSIRVTALNRRGEELASTTYTEDGRRQAVKAGAFWLDKTSFSVDPVEVPTSIAVTVLRNRHEVLHASGNDKFSFAVPVVAAIPLK